MKYLKDYIPNFSIIPDDEQDMGNLGEVIDFPPRRAVLSSDPCDEVMPFNHERKKDR